VFSFEMGIMPFSEGCGGKERTLANGIYTYPRLGFEVVSAL